MIAAEVLPSVTLRAAKPSDAALILDSWMRSYWRGGNAPNLPLSLFNIGHREVVEGLLKRCAVVVASNPEDEDQVFGWCCFERRKAIAVVHFVYVKHAFGRSGIGSALVKAAKGESAHVQHSHRTSDGNKFMKRFGSTWNPYTAGVTR